MVKKMEFRKKNDEDYIFINKLMYDSFYEGIDFVEWVETLKKGIPEGMEDLLWATLKGSYYEFDYPPCEGNPLTLLYMEAPGYNIGYIQKEGEPYHRTKDIIYSYHTPDYAEWDEEEGCYKGYGTYHYFSLSYDGEVSFWEEESICDIDDSPYNSRELYYWGLL